MILEAAQDFRLPYPGAPGAARAFLRDPGRSLSRLPFLRDLSFAGGLVRAELLVRVPMLGEVALPFASRVLDTEDGARLEPLTLPERLWAEVDGVGAVEEGTANPKPQLHYALTLRAHLELPQAERWGGAAFEKMLRETARRTLERVAREFPAGVAAAAGADGPAT